VKVSNIPRHIHKIGDIVRHKQSGSTGVIIAEGSVISLLQWMVLVDGDLVGWWSDSVEAIS
jgi:hypothetical protein